MPEEPVVPVWVAVLPFGEVRVKVTLAPEAAEPPFSTVTVMGTVLRRPKLVAETDTFAVSEGGLMTVKLAVPEPM